jgi:hypothetical protein
MFLLRGCGCLDHSYGLHPRSGASELCASWPVDPKRDHEKCRLPVAERHLSFSDGRHQSKAMGWDPALRFGQELSPLRGTSRPPFC